MLDQSIKGHYMSLHNTALLAQEKTSLHIVNENETPETYTINTEEST